MFMFNLVYVYTLEKCQYQIEKNSKKEKKKRISRK